MDTYQLNLLSPDHSLLIVIDQQPKLCAVMPKAELRPVAAHIGSLVQAAGILKIPVFISELCPIILGSTDNALTNRLNGPSQLFSKTSFSCFAAEGFYMALRRSGRRQIVLVGQEAHLSVLQTALELSHISYDTYVVSDAVCARKNHLTSNALQRLQQGGIKITNYESVLFEWMRDATHPHFRQISTLIKQ
jgi:nicotinamidase-related amidase